MLVPNVTGTGQKWKSEGLYFMNPRPSSKKASYDETPCNIPQFKVYPHAHFWWSHICNHSVEFSPFKFVCSSVFKSTTSEETLIIGFHCTHTWISTKSLQWRPVVVDMSGIAGRGMRAYLNMSIFQGSGLSWPFLRDAATGTQNVVSLSSQFDWLHHERSKNGSGGKML